MLVGARVGCWSRQRMYGGLCFTAETAGATVEMAAIDAAPSVVLEVSTDGTCWIPFQVGSTKITLADVGDRLYFRSGAAGNSRICSGSGTNRFVISGIASASGNVNSVLSRDFDGISSLPDNCYAHMFEGCEGLTSAPDVPVDALGHNCCYYMFCGCTGLTDSPALPATNLGRQCYYGMFRGCTSLASAPVLPAMSLSKGCYDRMFHNCVSLTSPPDLPATTLADGCYNYMFYACSHLTNAPTLPAETLPTNCYASMFKRCSSLSGIWTRQTSFDGCTDWLHNHAGAVFHCSPNLVIPDNRTESDVPSLWTIDKTYETNP